VSITHFNSLVEHTCRVGSTEIVDAGSFKIEPSAQRITFLTLARFPRNWNVGILILEGWKIPFDVNIPIFHHASIPYARQIDYRKDPLYPSNTS